MEAGEENTIVQEIDSEHEAELRREEDIAEALLFTMGRSVSPSELAVALNAGVKLADKALERLSLRYQERNSGILIRKMDGRYQMYTNPAAFESLIRVVKRPKKPVLTDVVLETLAIVAYRQPVTKAEIEKIRGVQSDHAVNKLVEYELVYESGRLNAPGRPALFCTTEEFLRRFGLESLEDLPGLNAEMQAELESEVEEEVREALGLPPEEDGLEIPEESEGTDGTEENGNN